jgi:hypothetical protein
MKRAFGFAALFTFAELLLCMIVAPSIGTPPQHFQWSVFPAGWNESVGKSNPLLFRYVRLSNWDSYHYFSAAKNGYHAPSGQWTRDEINNCQIEFSFLPAFPYFARAVSWLTSLPLEIALPLAAQIAAFLFYVFFFFALRRICSLPEKTTLVVMALFSVTPGAFYVVVPYSESIFLLSIAGAMFFTEEWLKTKTIVKKNVMWLMAAFCIAAASWSRMLGVVLALFPLFVSFRKELSSKDRVGALLLTGIAGAGTLSYFYFCRVYSGYWDAYFRLARIGWEIQPSYLAALNPVLYLPRFFFEEGEVSLQRSIGLLCIVGFVGSFLKDPDKRERLPYYATGGGLFYLTSAGKSYLALQGMVRYALPIFLIGIIPISIVFRDRVIELLEHRKSIFVLALLIIGFEVYYCHRYMHGLWVS